MNRTVAILVVMIAAAGGLLWWLNVKDAGPDLTLGGPVFAVEADRVEGLLVTRAGRQHRFDRLRDGGWTMSGATADFVGAAAMQALLDDLLAAPGGPVLPGTEPEDRRFEFNALQAVRATLLLAGGEDVGVAIGAANPVDGMRYASGAGRRACFQVRPELYERLAQLPVAVQLQTLLPVPDRGRVTAVDVQRGGRAVRAERADGRWWLLVEGDAVTESAFGRLAADYHAVYDDRLRRDGRGLWLRADPERVEGLIYEVSDAAVKQVLPPEEAPARAREWGLEPPWRRVTLHGPGLNPDPGDTADRLTIAFGPPLVSAVAPALRRGHVLLADAECVMTLEKPVSALADLRALDRPATGAQAVMLAREGRELLRGARTGEPDPADGREAWRTTSLAAGEAEVGARDRQGLVRDLVVDLDRLPILAVLPPVDDAGALRPEERVRLELDYPDGVVVYELGRLAPARLPADFTPAPDPEGESPSALWSPATGRLVQVPDRVLITARNLARIVGAP
jgi:hypothetical protein